MSTQGSGPTSDVVVQKYGGSSLATVSQVRQVADRVGALARSGRRVVVVVSAQGDTTDELIGRAGAVNPHPAGHELDQLLATGETASAALMAMALQHSGLAATALSGSRSGILATGPHGAGVIVAIDTEQLRTLLDAGQVVVIAGFQGVTADGDIITLGRGGSDTTAVAVAAELRAGHCEIYSDVRGVYTADPRVVPDARLMPDIDIDVMTEMAFAGARVMHSRAVELAALYDVDILVGRSTATRTGTRIHRLHRRDGNDMLEDRTAVMAVVHDTDIARITLRTHDTPDPSPDVFRFLAEESIPADMTTVASAPGGGFSLGLTVHRSHAADVSRSFSDLMARRRHGVEVEDQVAKVSIVGQGLLSRPEYASRMLASLVGSGISARSLSASQLRVSVTVPSSDAVRAVVLLHSEFGLGAEAGAMPASLSPRP
ncbi:aspartate kinase [Streptomyces cyaneofuscatus]|uniref:aspartate kinase n=1 Tax=Streptomyces cyaneofuscatus TaxID=66883 RepID=UPI002D7939F2|nr:aspartate kinase [Streptomyces cyaneofuscatus]WRO10777.1 aspartate kinase [Streptomyces cyaneofuscatus]